MKNDAEVVYFIQENGPKALIKIGCSFNARFRMSAIKLWSPYPIKLLTKMAGNKTLESWFHVRFSEYRFNGEWFLPSLNLLSTIAEIKKNKSFSEIPEFCDPFDDANYTSNMNEIIGKIGISVTDLAEKSSLSQATIRNCLSSYDWKTKSIRYGRVASPKTIHSIINYANSIGIVLKPEWFVIKQENALTADAAIEYTDYLKFTKSEACGGIHA